MPKLLNKIVLLLCVLGSTGVSAEQSITFVNSEKALATGLPFSEAVKVGDTYYLSGQIGVVPGTLTLAEGGMEAQARQTMENIKATLAGQKMTMSNIVKCTVMMADMSQWSAFNTVYKSYFEGAFPARSAFGANGLALGALVEVECIAVSTR